MTSSTQHAAIIGIGSDITYIPRMRETLESQGDRFLARCFTDTEVQYIKSAKTPDLQAGRMAKRWAAKEAYAKALGTGIVGDIKLKDIEVVRADNGKPSLHVHNGALQALHEHGTHIKIDLSLSDDGDYAQAFVVLSRENN